MPTLLALFLLGSEVRQFGHSGLFSGLISRGWRVVVAAQVVDDDLRAQLDPDIELRLLPNDRPTFQAGQAQAIVDEANARRLARSSGVQAWEYVRARPQNWRQRVLSGVQRATAALLSRAQPLYRAGQAWERRAFRGMPKPGWAALLDDVRPDALLLNVPKAANIAVGLAEAQARGVPIVLLYHTWKDVTVAGGRLSHHFAAVGVWNEWMRAACQRQNPDFPAERIHVSGCAHFDSVGRADLLMPEAEFRRAIGLKPGAPILLFTASAPWVVPQEARFIDVLMAGIGRGELPPDLQIVVRTNPMDGTGALESALDGRYADADVIVMSPGWRWDKARNWGFQRKPDQMRYNSLLHYAAVAVSVPSTVTVECAVADLPVVNIGFDLPGIVPLNGSIRTFWNADFYRLVRDTGAAALAETPDALVRLVARALADRAWGHTARAALVGRQLGVPPPGAAVAGAALIEAVVR